MSPTWAPGTYVDWRASLSYVGTLVKYVSIPLLFPLLVGLYYQDGSVLVGGLAVPRGVFTFGTTILIALGSGHVLEGLDADPDIGAREGFLLVGLSWVAVSVVGAVPYLIAGQGSVAVPINALFESMSGFTTTGATVMADISFSTHSHALLLWRQETQWLGGMGIVVLAVAILPELSVGGAQLMDAEAPGPGLQKLTPRIAETARALWKAYIGITVLEIVLLLAVHSLGFAPNMTPYNAVAHGFTTLSTGGFSPEARSIEAFSATVQWLIIPFMLAAGTNFALFWHLMTRDFGALRRDAEFRFYLGIVGTVAAVLTGLLFFDVGMAATPANVGPIAGNFGNALRHAAFQAAAITTTTGYASMDFNTWSPAAQFVLFVAMFIGGSAGSTGGAVKIVRWLVILKALKRELFTTVHPEAVRPIRLGGRALDERAVRGIYTFTLLYFVCFAIGTVLVVANSWRVGAAIPAFEAMSATAAMIGNVGPGFGAVGPMNNYLAFPASTKLLMIGLMWIGRLEIIPALVLLTPAYWRS